MNETEIARVLRENFDGLTQKDASAALDVDRSNLSTKLIGEKGPYYAIKLARARGLDVIETLVRAGWITVQEVAEHAGARTLAGATDVQLSQEIVNRVQRGGFHAALTEPVDEVATFSEGDGATIDVPRPD